MSEEYVSIGQLRAELGISKAKMAQLIKSGKVPWIENEWDKRIKLVRRADADKLIAEARAMGKGVAVAA